MIFIDDSGARWKDYNHPKSKLRVLKLILALHHSLPIEMIQRGPIAKHWKETQKT